MVLAFFVGVYEVAVDEEHQDVATLGRSIIAGGESRIKEAQQPQAVTLTNVGLCLCFPWRT